MCYSHPCNKLCKHPRNTWLNLNNIWKKLGKFSFKSFALTENYSLKVFQESMAKKKTFPRIKLKLICLLRLQNRMVQLKGKILKISIMFLLALIVICWSGNFVRFGSRMLSWEINWSLINLFEIFQENICELHETKLNCTPLKPSMSNIILLQ